MIYLHNHQNTCFNELMSVGDIKTNTGVWLKRIWSGLENNKEAKRKAKSCFKRWRVMSGWKILRHALICYQLKTEWHEVTPFLADCRAASSIHCQLLLLNFLVTLSLSLAPVREVKLCRSISEQPSIKWMTFDFAEHGSEKQGENASMTLLPFFEVSLDTKQ